MKKIKKNKKMIIFVLLLFGVLVFSSYNTFISNDDLSYSFFYRGNVRITNIIQVIKHQIADYFSINGRFFIHCIIQTLLIFDKKVWAILNPIIIILLLYFIIRISNIYNSKNNKDKNLMKMVLCSIMFLLMINYKYIIYWVAGSVNYIWLSFAITLYIYYYLTKGIEDKYILNSIIILIVSILHEMSLVFMIVLITGNLILKKIKKEKISKKYIFYFISLIISSVFILMSPGNHNRMNADTTWVNMSIFEKMLTSTPIVSKNLFNLTNPSNIIPIILIISIIYKLVRNNNKLLALSMLSISILAIISGNNYIYIILALLAFISEVKIYLKEKSYQWIIISLSFYAVVYSTIIVPNYADGRPNFFFYIYSILVIINFFENLFKSKVLKISLLCICLILMIKEVSIYNIIGNIHKERLNSISKCKETNCEILKLKKIPQKYKMYHIDINSPSNSSYYTYKFFINYYELPNGIKIEYYD